MICIKYCSFVSGRRILATRRATDNSHDIKWHHQSPPRGLGTRRIWLDRLARTTIRRLAEQSTTTTSFCTKNLYRYTGDPSTSRQRRSLDTISFFGQVIFLSLTKYTTTKVRCPLSSQDETTGSTNGVLQSGGFCISHSNIASVLSNISRRSFGLPTIIIGMSFSHGQRVDPATP